MEKLLYKILESLKSIHKLLLVRYQRHVHSYVVCSWKKGETGDMEARTLVCQTCFHELDLHKYRLERMEEEIEDETWKY